MDQITDIERTDSREMLGADWDDKNPNFADLIDAVHASGLEFHISNVTGRMFVA